MIKKQLSSLNIETRCFIDGNFHTALSGRTLEKVCPVDNSAITGIPACDEKDVALAVNSARRSFEHGIWRKSSVKEKKTILYKLARLMRENLNTLAMLDTWETGRSYRNYFYDSIPKSIEVLEYFVESLDKVYDQCISTSSGSLATVMREPLGVVACITPWNDPLVPAMWKMAPALLMGNSVIMKPAEQSSLSMIKLAGLALEAGVPPGVLNVVTGYGEQAGKALALHNDVDGVFFTGSSEVGKLILTYSGLSNMKKVGLECGGKSPYIVSSAKRLKKAAQTLAANIFYNQGQICSAPSRAFVHNNLKAEFIDLLKSEAEKFVPGDPFSLESLVGGVVSLEQKQKIETYIEEGKHSGFICHQSGKSTKLPLNGVMPTIFVDPPHDSKLATEEIFGPVLVVFGFDDIDKAIALANCSKYGLAGAIWTDDLDEAHYVSRSIRSGLVHVNSYGMDDNTVPFGGYKQSGLGKDKSVFAFYEYSHIKTTWVEFNTQVQHRQNI